MVIQDWQVLAWTGMHPVVYHGNQARGSYPNLGWTLTMHLTPALTLNPGVYCEE